MNPEPRSPKTECRMPNDDLGQIGQIVLIYNVINLWAKSSRAASLMQISMLLPETRQSSAKADAGLEGRG